MNNPYRARLGRQRVDHTATAAAGGAVPSYGVRNQNSWAPMTGNQSQPVIGGANQTNNADDSWDWNTENADNGNDSWNWNIDQSADQTQLHQQQQQQPPPTHGSNYTNMRPAHQNLVQDNYYTNINGNRQVLAGQHQLPQTGNLPQTRESTPSQSDSYSQYPNFPVNQTQQTPPRTSSTNSSVSDNQNQAQWQTNQQQQQQGIFNPYAPPRPSTFEPTNQQQTQQFNPNAYNWNGVEQTGGHIWQNQTTEPFWQDQNANKKEEYHADVDKSRQRAHDQFKKSPPQNSVKEMPGQWQPDNHDNNQMKTHVQETVPSNQWREDAHDSRVVEPQTQFIQNHPRQPDNFNVNQSWSPVNLQSNTSVKPEVDNKLSDVNLDNSPVNYSIPASLPDTTTIDSRPEEQNVSVYTSSSQAAPVLDTTSNLFAPPNTGIESKIIDKVDRRNVDSLVKNDVNTMSDITASVKQLNIEDKDSHSQQYENHPSLFPVHSMAQPVEQWPNQSIQSINKPTEPSALSSQHIAQTLASPQEHYTPVSFGSSESKHQSYDHTGPPPNIQSFDHVSSPQPTIQPHEYVAPPTTAQPSYYYQESAMFTSHQITPVMNIPEASGSPNLTMHAATQKPPYNSLENTIPINPMPYPVNTESVQGPSEVPKQTNVPPTEVRGIPTTQGYDQWYNQKTSPPQNVRYPIAERSATMQQQKPWPSTEPVDNYEASKPSEFVNDIKPLVHESEALERQSSVKEASEEDKVLIATEPIAKNSMEQSVHPVNQQVLPVNQQANSIQQVNPVNQQIHPINQQIQSQHEQTSENYEFASNDRNTFLETGELTDLHHEQGVASPNHDEENDEVPSDIPFLREVPGQSSYGDPRRNDPTGQEQYVQSNPRIIDSRRNPSEPALNTQGRPIAITPSDRTERRDVPPGQERRESRLLSRDTDTPERRNDPSGRERSLPPSQSRNDPSGEERIQSQNQINLEPAEIRQVPGSGTDSVEPPPSAEVVRQITGGVSRNEPVIPEVSNARVVTGSQQVLPAASVMQDLPSNETRNKREEAVGASIENPPAVTNSPKRRDSYQDGDDEESGNSRDDNRERRRDPSPTDRRRYDYDPKGDRSYFDREREYTDDFYYDRRRGHDYERAYNSREDLDRRDASFREGDRRHLSRDDLDDRRRLKDDDRRGHRSDVDPRRRDARDYDAPRYPRDRDFDRWRDDRRRRYPDYDPRDTRDPRDPRDSRDPRDPRDARDPRREYYDDPYARSSRPSSRSSYNDREYYARREPYYGYNNGYNAFDYGTNYNNNYYAYLEDLRRTNPTAYMEWYNKYYGNQQHNISNVARVPGYPEDRASVHSGRSSCDDRTNSGKHTIGDISLLEDSRIVSRLTPTKFSTSHVQGSFSIGSLVQVHASYPADGERARVDIVQVDSLLMHDPITREIRAYPGPLVKGVTHKKTIIEYCEAKIKKAAVNAELIDHASYILLYQLMIMLIQQNGNVVGVDIATLLLRNKEVYPYDMHKTNHKPIRRESTISQRSGGAGREGSVHEEAAQEIEEVKPIKTVEQITNEFRNTLLCGLVQEALEYAMTEGLWGHALFLASKLDKRTHASVMTRFANSLPVQDPLQTLYQLHSGRVPASVTCVADSKWDDWRPHLAMIISNTSANPEINRRAISTLGDTLTARGDIHAAHFCYILAQIDFGIYGTPGVKLVLIGSNHHKSYVEFATLEAVMLTEIYEYARNLSEPGFTIVGLQTYKFEIAQKMVDYGLIEKALLYLEQIAVNIVQEPSKYTASFINNVYTLSERIKFHDPVFKDCIEDVATLTWLNNLSDIVGRCQTGEIVQESSNVNTRTDAPNVMPDHEQRDTLQQWNYQQDYSNAPVSMMEVPAVDTNQDTWQPMSLPNNLQEPYTADQNIQYGQNVDGNQYHQQQQQQQQQSQQEQSQEYWNQQTYNQNYSRDYNSDWQQQSNQMQYHGEQTDVDSAQAPGWNYESDKEEKPPTPEPQSLPQISMNPSTKQYDPLEELDSLDPSDHGKSSGDNKKQDKQTEKKTGNSGGSWFGGLFSKLTPKPKNQMILPDDNNPTIVWDPVAKKWSNKDEDGDSGSSRLAPPPKITEMNLPTSAVEQIQKPPSIPEQSNSTHQNQHTLDRSTPNSSKMITGSNNMFKLQKSRSMRANYIDVMNPGGGVKSNGPPSNLPTPANSPMMPMAASSPQLFVPAPVNDPNAPVDFLTPAPAPVPQNESANQGLSRWSSTSSLSREVQSYTMRDPRLQQRIKGPMMYNPANVTDNSAMSVSKNRYPRR